MRPLARYVGNLRKFHQDSDGFDATAVWSNAGLREVTPRRKMTGATILAFPGKGHMATAVVSWPDTRKTSGLLSIRSLRHSHIIDSQHTLCVLTESDNDRRGRGGVGIWPN